MEMSFFMAMLPPTATHQEKQVVIVNGKPRFFEPPVLKDARAKLSTSLARFRPNEPIPEGTPVRLTVKWCFQAGKGHKPGTWRVTKPDTDNLQKLLKDCMTQTGFWADDAQVCSETVEKFWTDTPGIYISITTQ